MESLRFNSKDKNLLKPIYSFAKAHKVKLYLVGGYLRDLILGRAKENPDFDFCLKKGAINFAGALAKKIRAGFVVLDKEHGACRLVKKIHDKTYTFDFTDFRRKTLEEDLLRRDFTINSIAIELDKVFTENNPDNFVIDLFKGRADLKHKIIKAMHKDCFQEDPLRILRAFSLACILGFEINRRVLSLARLERNRLVQISFERIRDELFKIFHEPCGYDYLVKLDKLKILKIIFPEIEKMRNVKGGPYHHLDVWGHSLETVRQLEGIIKELSRNSEIRDYLFETISAERKRSALLKLGALLHDIGKPDALRRKDGKLIFHGHERIGLEISKTIARRLKLSNDEIDALNKMVLWHLRPGYLADNKVVTKKASFRFFRDTAGEAASVLLISLADQRATRGRLTTKQSRLQHEKVVSSLLKVYFLKKKEKKLPRLITGDDLINRLKLRPSPLIGKILSTIEELQAIGKVKTKKEAFRIADKIIRSKRG